jgi:hypothetical protein
MLPQPRQTKLVCCRALYLFVVELGSLDISLNADNFDPDTGDQLVGHAVGVGGSADRVGDGEQIHYH